MAYVKKFLKNNLLIVIIFVLLLYFGPAIYKPAQANEKAIATAIGIDKNESEYEVSLLIIIPTAEKTDSYNGVELVSASGVSLGDAINAIALDIGKSVGLCHCDAVILNDEILKEDLRSTLDYLNRSGELTKNALIFNTPESSKDVLSTAISSKAVSAIKISTMVEFNKEHAISKDASLDGFYTGYYTPSSVSLFPIVTVQEQTENSSVSEQSASTEGSQNASAGGGENKKFLECNGDICVVKSGIKVAELKGENLPCYNVLKPNIKNALIKLSNVNGDGFEDASMMLEIRNKKVSKKATFDNGMPVLNYKVHLVFRVLEINNKNSDINSLSEVESKVNTVVKQKVIDQVSASFDKTMALAVESNVDLFEFDNYFSAYKSSEWNEFKSLYTEPKDYLTKLAVNIDFDIEGKY